MSAPAKPYIIPQIWNVHTEGCASLNYSSHDGIQGHNLNIDRCDDVLQVELVRGTDGESIVAEFTLAEAEEIAASVAHVCRNIRKHRA
jgi:hypothetical protein